MKLFFWKKPQKVFETVTKRSLTVSFYDNTSLTWSFLPQTKEDKIGNPWQYFYDWYFKKHSQYITIEYQNGETTIQRKDIKRFELQTSKKLVEKTVIYNFRDLYNSGEEKKP